MATVTKIGPEDHGRPMTFDDYMAADYQEGYEYELIRGRLYVSPKANRHQGRLETWIYKKVDAYSQDHPEVINYVTHAARVFISEEAEVTAPEPDVVAYQDFPVDQDLDEGGWEDCSPILVVEVL